MDSLTKGKAAEVYVWLSLLRRGMVPYVPVTDIQGVDLFVLTSCDTIARVQVKSRGTPLADIGGEQIKNLKRGRDKIPFDVLIIVLPKNSSGEYEGWVVPKHVVKSRMTPRGDINMSHRLMKETWWKYHESWDLIGRCA